MNGTLDGSYEVTQVTIRQAPQLSATGQMAQVTVLSFLVGRSGPFSVTWSGTRPTPQEIIAAIQAQVQDIQAVGAGVAQLNQTSSAGTVTLP